MKNRASLPWSRQNLSVSVASAAAVWCRSPSPAYADCPLVGPRDSVTGSGSADAPVACPPDIALPLVLIGTADRNSRVRCRLWLLGRVASAVERVGAAIAPKTENGSVGSTIGSADVERTWTGAAMTASSGALSQRTAAAASTVVSGGRGMFTMARQRAMTSTPAPTSAKVKPASLRSKDVPA